MGNAYACMKNKIPNFLVNQSKPRDECKNQIPILTYLHFLDLKKNKADIKNHTLYYRWLFLNFTSQIYHTALTVKGLLFVTVNTECENMFCSLYLRRHLRF